MDETIDEALLWKVEREGLREWFCNSFVEERGDWMRSLTGAMLAGSLVFGYGETGMTAEDTATEYKEGLMVEIDSTKAAYENVHIIEEIHQGEVCGEPTAEETDPTQVEVPEEVQPGAKENHEEVTDTAEPDDNEISDFNEETNEDLTCPEDGPFPEDASSTSSMEAEGQDIDVSGAANGLIPHDSDEARADDEGNDETEAEEHIGVNDENAPELQDEGIPSSSDGEGLDEEESDAVSGVNPLPTVPTDTTDTMDGNMKTASVGDDPIILTDIEIETVTHGDSSTGQLPGQTTGNGTHTSPGGSLDTGPSGSDDKIGTSPGTRTHGDSVSPAPSVSYTGGKPSNSQNGVLPKTGGVMDSSIMMRLSIVLLLIGAGLRFAGSKKRKRQ